MKRLFLAVLIGLGALIAIIFARAMMIKSSDVAREPIPADGQPLDEAALGQRLAGGVKFPTISHQDPAQDDTSQMTGFRAYLAGAFPRAFGALKPEVVGGGSLLLTWSGADATLKPVLLLSHMDVVPISPGTEKDWLHPPFGGDIDSGYVWGRGTLDDKCGVIGILEAAEQLLADGYVPKRTLIFAFGHDEEVGGRHGAAAVSELLKSRGVDAEYVLDEGGLVSVGLLDGLAKDTAMIGIAEKGYLSVELTVDTHPGHSSQPPKVTAIGRLSRAIASLEEHPMRPQLSGALREMLVTLAPDMGFGHRLAIANLWIFEPVLRWFLSGSDSGRASLGTTFATTIFQSGDKDNVLPAKARAVVNLRLLPGDTAAAALEHMRSVIDDPEVTIRPIPGYVEASPVSDARAPQFLRVAAAARATFPDAIPAPFLTLGGTDSIHYENLSKNIYRFLPAHFNKDDMGRFHGTNERISLADYAATVRFYRHLMRDSGA